MCVCVCLPDWLECVHTCVVLSPNRHAFMLLVSRCRPLVGSSSQWFRSLCSPYRSCIGNSLIESRATMASGSAYERISVDNCVCTCYSFLPRVFILSVCLYVCLCVRLVTCNEIDTSHSTTGGRSMRNLFLYLHLMSNFFFVCLSGRFPYFQVFSSLAFVPPSPSPSPKSMFLLGFSPTHGNAGL